MGNDNFGLVLCIQLNNILKGFPSPKNKTKNLSHPLYIVFFHQRSTAGFGSHSLAYSSQVTADPHLKSNEELKNFGAPVMCYFKNNSIKPNAFPVSTASQREKNVTVGVLIHLSLWVSLFPTEVIQRRVHRSSLHSTPGQRVLSCYAVSFCAGHPFSPAPQEWRK